MHLRGEKNSTRDKSTDVKPSNTPSSSTHISASVEVPGTHESESSEGSPRNGKIVISGLLSGGDPEPSSVQKEDIERIHYPEAAKYPQGKEPSISQLKTSRSNLAPVATGPTVEMKNQI
ncbi:hypothetical protein PCASD_07416 [Puccinia coronata f. sp. avenae]|uniref:Uncharacterized protein n=1 Tax=Puccinia coronata f. sp. avenae TaxID=200324 RepID=A0A2N5V984_9BASI|nr:hypothetical protein PCASD_07416 [Puccinia coronata f. sp. avenae]